MTAPSDTDLKAAVERCEKEVAAALDMAKLERSCGRDANARVHQDRATAFAFILSELSRLTAICEELTAALDDALPILEAHLAVFDTLKTVHPGIQTIELAREICAGYVERTSSTIAKARGYQT